MQYVMLYVVYKALHYAKSVSVAPNPCNVYVCARVCVHVHVLMNYIMTWPVYDITSVYLQYGDVSAW